MSIADFYNKIPLVIVPFLCIHLFFVSPLCLYLLISGDEIRFGLQTSVVKGVATINGTYNHKVTTNPK